MNMQIAVSSRFNVACKPQAVFNKINFCTNSAYGSPSERPECSFSLMVKQNYRQFFSQAAVADLALKLYSFGFQILAASVWNLGLWFRVWVARR